VCAATDATADPTPADAPAPALDSAALTASRPATSSEPTTAPAPLDPDTASYSVGGAAPLPAAPPGYELLRSLGSGGMGDVYLAREHPSERLVAIKFLRRAGDIERFVTELQALAKLEHPNVVRVLASDFLRDVPFFTLEYVAGGSLSAALKPRPGERKSNLPPVAGALALIRQVAAGVAAAHALGIIHRDIKPGNILLGGARDEDRGASKQPSSLDPRSSILTPKVSDFGLAKLLDRDSDLTRTGGLGTPSYMPPEQVSGKNGAIGAWSDVYGLGATLYHLLTGRPPFTGATPEEIILRVLADPPARPRALQPDLPLGLEAIVLKCLEKDPTDRYPTVAALLADLDRYEAGARPAAPPMTRVRRVKRWAARNRRSLGAAAVALFAVASAFLVGGAFRGEPPSVPPPSKPLPDPAAEQAQRLAEIEKELDSLGAGDRVEFIGDKGFPRWSRWAVGKGILVPADTGDGTVALQTRGLSLLELVPDPRRERYRVSVWLRHLQANPLGGDVGVYIGHDVAGTLHSVLWGQFSELLTIDEMNDAVLRAHHGVSFAARTLYTVPDQSPTFGRQTERGHLRFTPFQGQPRPWRVLIFDVSPDGIELFWATGKPAADGKPAAVGERKLVGRLSGQALADERQRVQQELNDKVNPAPVIRAWHPRRPLGVWASDSDVSIKSVTIEPLNPR
jgi:serine/threonine-protein kinase